MKKIKHIIQTEFGLHARPAGRLVKIASGFTSIISVGTKSKMGLATNIMQVMALGLQQGDEIILTISGDDENEAAQNIRDYLQENL